jgi:hypothetical protein
MFCSFPNVEPETNKRHPTIDFYINDKPFDLKVTRLPSSWNRVAALANPSGMLNWYYLSQSKESRYGMNNRFILAPYCTSRKQEWRLKANLLEIYSQVAQYMLKYDERKLISLPNGAVADLIVPLIA